MHLSTADPLCLLGYLVGTALLPVTYSTGPKLTYTILIPRSSVHVGEEPQNSAVIPGFGLPEPWGIIYLDLHSLHFTGWLLTT